MSVIKIATATHLSGVKYWRQDFPYRVPRFEVFVYLGQDQDKGLFFFRSRPNPKTIITKSFYQLNTNGFYPFLLDMKLINAYAETLTNGPLI